MTIARETLLHVLRRRWRVLLVVFLCGVALVVVSKAYDVQGILDEIQGIAESEAPPGEEQMGGMMRGAGVLFLMGVLGFLFQVGTLMVAVLLPGGIVANERRSGAVMLWAQHPMPLTRFYLHRYLGIQGVNLAAHVLFALVVIVAVLPGNDPATGVPNQLVMTDPGRFAQVLMTGALACAVSYAITALGLRRAAFFAIAYVFASSIAWSIVDPAFGLGAPVPDWVKDLLPFLIFPDNPIDDFVAGFASGTDWNWGATGMVVYHFALWTGAALLGLRRLERRPVML